MSEPADVAVEEIDRLVTAGQWTDAGAVAERARAENPGDARLVSRAVRIVARLEGPDAALARLLAEVGVIREQLAALVIELTLAAGRYDEGVQAARARLGEAPDDVEAAGLLLDGLELAGRIDEAFEVARDLCTRPAMRDLGAQRALELEATARAFPRWLEAPAPTAEETALAPEGRELSALERAFAIFGGNPEVHARQTRFRSGEWGYVPMNGGLTHDLLARHLSGEMTLGVYLLDRGARVRAMALDLDVTREHLPAFLESREEHAALERDMRICLKAVLERAAGAGLALLPEASGFKGYHLWAFFHPVPAALAREVGQALVAPVELPSGLRFEVFPKQDRLTGKGLGNLVKLPLGLHRRSERRSVLLEPETLEEVERHCELERLSRWRVHEAAELVQILRSLGGRWRPARTGSPVAVDEQPAVRVELRPVERTETDGDPRALIPWPEVLPAPVDAVMRGCALVRGLVEGIRDGRTVTPAARHVIVHVFAHLGEEGRLFVHQVLCRGAGYDPDLVNRALHAVGRWPIGCRRVVELLEGADVRRVCECPQASDTHRYASPVGLAGVSVPARHGETGATEGRGTAGARLEQFLGRRAGPPADDVAGALRESRRRLLIEELEAAERPRAKLRVVEPDREAGEEGRGSSNDLETDHDPMGS